MFRNKKIEILVILCLLGSFLKSINAAKRSSQETKTVSAGLSQFLGEDLNPKCVISVRPNPYVRYINRFSEPLLTKNPGDCCKRCIDMEECIAWTWRACCNHCWIKHAQRAEDPAQNDYCGSDDCVEGFVDRTGNRTQQDLLNELNEFVHERPFPDYLPTYLRRCDKEFSWHAAAAALEACGTVKEKCGVERTLTLDEDLEAQDVNELHTAPSCKMEYNKNYYGNDIAGFNPHPIRQTAEECCRRCQEFRGCRAWARVPNGECFLKWNAEDLSPRKIAGHISGKKIEVPDKCTQGMKGFKFIPNPEDRIQPEFNSNSTDECCQSCLKILGCEVWSFGNGECLMNYGLERYLFRLDANFTTGFVLPINEKETCRDIQKKNPVGDLGELAYNVTKSIDPICYSILNGTYKKAKNCAAERAQKIFKRSVERTLTALGMIEPSSHDS